METGSNQSTGSNNSYASKVKGAQTTTNADGDNAGTLASGNLGAIPEAATYMSGNPAVQTVTGIIHLYRTDYAFDVSGMTHPLTI